MTMDETTTTTIRLPGSILQALRELAASNDRSLNAEIVRVLREHVEASKGWACATGGNENETTS